MTDDQELNTILASPGESLGRPKANYVDGDTLCEEGPPSEAKDKRLANVVQWTTDDDRRFIPAARTCGNLPPGLYEVKSNPAIGTYFEGIPVKTEGLLRFPQTNSERIVEEIQRFWEKEAIFRDFKLVHKRGILTWGPPGSGKSCTIQLILKDVVERGGVAINFTQPDLFLDGMRLLRSIQPKTPVVVLLEDIDEIINHYSESRVLNLLDGVEILDKTVFLATTNYPEHLGPRIVNRPSRFDKRFKIGHPNEESRMIYFKHLLRDRPDLIAANDLGRWVEDTDGLSLAHLKELFVAVIILGDEYEAAIETLQSMREHLVSEPDNAGPIGFAGVTKRLHKSRNGEKRIR